MKSQVSADTRRREKSLSSRQFSKKNIVSARQTVQIRRNFLLLVTQFDSAQSAAYLHKSTGKRKTELSVCFPNSGWRAKQCECVRSSDDPSHKYIAPLAKRIRLVKKKLDASAPVQHNHNRVKGQTPFSCSFISRGRRAKEPNEQSHQRGHISYYYFSVSSAAGSQPCTRMNLRNEQQRNQKISWLTASSTLILKETKRAMGKKSECMHLDLHVKSLLICADKSIIGTQW